MKRTVFTCDRCKLQLMNANGTINTTAVALYSVRAKYNEDIDLPIDEYDLCDGCAAGFRTWVGS